jgi:hypothetical protein
VSSNYVLDENGNPKAEPDALKWAKWLEANIMNRHVADETVGKARISTVFLGLDHAWGGGVPLLYETMIFGGEHDGYQTRCSTKEQAIEQHRAAVDLVSGDK